MTAHPVPAAAQTYHTPVPGPDATFSRFSDA